MIIAIDFDGTCTTHDFPQVGSSIGAEKILKKLVDAGHKLILHTMRSGEHLQDAIKWFEAYNIPLYSVQVNPTQAKWTSSPKCFANLYIDDAALGCPLVVDKHKKPYVDWDRVEELLINMKAL